MMKKTLLLLLFFVSMFKIQAQAVFEGVIKDKDSNENLAYVNVGILNKNVGTVSDPNGKFQLPLDAKYDLETIKISMIGYKSVTYNVAEFRKKFASNPILYLEKNVAELKEVVINGKLKNYVLGNVLDRRPVSAGFVNNILGNEIGMVIKVHKTPTYIQGFRAVIDYNHYKEFKFRLNFYEMKNGLPDATLLTENIIVSSTLKKGELNVDLTEYNISTDKDFFVSIELIEGLGEGGLHFLADYDGPKIITRAASQGKWNKQDDLSFGFSVSVKQ